MSGSGELQIETYSMSIGVGVGALMISAKAVVLSDAFALGYIGVLQEYICPELEILRV